MLIDLARPAATPSMIAELSNHLKLPIGFADAQDHAATLSRVLGVALCVVEERTRRALLARTLTLRLTAWDADGRARLPLSPVQRIEAITLTDGDGASADSDPSQWRLQTVGERAYVAPRPGRALPVVPRDGYAEVRFVAGYGEDWAAAPGELRHAALLVAAECFEGRAAGAAALPPAAAGLLARYRPVRL